MISVIIRTKDRVDSLMETLDSVLSQDYVGYEVIVVDDHSSDNTRQRVVTLTLAHSNLQYMVSEGVRRGGARNSGVNVAKGDILAFCDDDTWVPRNWLQVIADTIREGYDAVGFTYYYPEEYRSKRWSMFSAMNHSIGPKLFALALGVEATTIGGGCGAVTKRVVDDLGYWSEKAVRAEDLDYGIRFLRKGYRKKNIEWLKVIHKHHRMKRLDDEGHYSRAYEWLKTMLKQVDNTFRNRLIILVYLAYRLLIQAGFCLQTRNLRPLDMSKGNVAAFREWAT